MKGMKEKMKKAFVIIFAGIVIISMIAPLFTGLRR